MARVEGHTHSVSLLLAIIAVTRVPTSLPSLTLITSLRSHLLLLAA